MLTQLATVKARLGIDPLDTTSDDLLTRAIAGVSARFDRECNRTFARKVDATQEFPADDTDIVARHYPVESVSRFELKNNELEDWIEQPGRMFLLREHCIISLTAPMVLIPEVSGVRPKLARVTYTGGYVLPGATPGAGQTALPADIETAAVEQVAVWYQQRDKLGLLRHWPSGGIFQVFGQEPLLPQVSAMLQPHRRWTI